MGVSLKRQLLRQGGGSKNPTKIPLVVDYVVDQSLTPPPGGGVRAGLSNGMVRSCQPESTTRREAPSLCPFVSQSRHGYHLEGQCAVRSLHRVGLCIVGVLPVNEEPPCRGERQPLGRLRVLRYKAAEDIP